MSCSRAQASVRPGGVDGTGFCLVTPNWTKDLPGFPYDGDDPQGFVPRDEVVAYLERYAASFDAPVRTGVEGRELLGAPGGGFLLHTSVGEMRSHQVVLATGAYQRPHRPLFATAFPGRLLVIDADDYATPDARPPGPVLVIGSGETGARRCTKRCPKRCRPRASTFPSCRCRRRSRRIHRLRSTCAASEP